MKNQYSVLAECYDSLNSHIDYESWAEKLSKELLSHGVGSSALVLDLACGTGNITLPLSKLGYDMIGIDISEEMLSRAMQKDKKNKILWLCQDIREFELYGTVGAVVCCLDSINYLTSRAGLNNCFKLVHNYLDPNGIFIFDVNTLYKFENVYSFNHFILEDEEVYCGWKNYFDKKSGLCDFELSFFKKSDNGSYVRQDEYQREKYWSIKVLKNTLEKNGFEVIKIVSDLDSAPLTDTSERAFFICKAKK